MRRVPPKPKKQKASISPPNLSWLKKNLKQTSILTSAQSFFPVYYFKFFNSTESKLSGDSDGRRRKQGYMVPL